MSDLEARASRSLDLRCPRQSARWCVAIFGVVLLIASSTEASRAQAGAYSRMGFGARGIAMSNGLVADISGLASPYYNPALAPFMSEQNLEGTVALMSMDRQLQFLQFATPLRPRAGIAAGLIHAGVSGIDGRDGSGYHTQEYSTDEFAFFLAFGSHLSDRVSAGVAFQIFRADFLEGLPATNSIGIDVGLLYRMNETLAIGLALDDLLARYTWDTSSAFGSGGKTTRDNFPTRLRLGASYLTLGARARISAEYETSFTRSEFRSTEVGIVGGMPVDVNQSERLLRHGGQARLGAEYMFNDIFGLRAGVDHIGLDEVGGMKPGLGFTLSYPVGDVKLRADYAFVVEPYAVGTLHFITLRVAL